MKPTSTARLRAPLIIQLRASSDSRLDFNTRDRRLMYSAMALPTTHRTPAQIAPNPYDTS